MIKVLQIGEGNFLRTFVDAYFNKLNEEGHDYNVNICKPIKFGSLEKFKKQNNRYHIVLRGMNEGKAVEDVYEINCVKSVFDPFDNLSTFIKMSADKDLKIIVSNTTEAGICYNEKDKYGNFDDCTYPAKLTVFLYERFKAGLEGLYLMPVELIENNADELYRCVDKYIEHWGLGDDFKKWNDTQNYYCNTLVDRIVSGYPKDDETKAHITELIGEEDELMSIGEPFGLWAVEDKGEISKYIKDGVHNIEVVLTKNIAYYKKRKVRVLNGSHTNLVPYGLWKGKETVYDCMNDSEILKFINDTLTNEIIPFVSDDIQATTAFSQSVIERFKNPFLNHQLTSIALNGISKWKARDLPSFKDYYKKYGKIPANLSKGFGYLMALYKNAVKESDGKYYVTLPTRKIEIKDDIPYLEYFANGGCVVEFMQKTDVWGEDLTAYAGFADVVKEVVKSLGCKGNC